jgi:acyl-CoA synthetase (AMP-forming)/AMP-acid ligase II
MHEFWSFEGQQPARPALALPAGPGLTYGELSDKADFWAGQLRQLTSGRRCVVAIELDVDPDSIAAYLGALRAGYPILVLEPGQIVTSSRIMAAWTPEICIPAGADVPVLTHLPDAEAPEPHPDLRVLLSTSGSTGDPKLVRLSAGNIAANARSIADYLGLTPEDRAATTLPLHYSYGLSVLNSYLSAGASLLLQRQSVIEPGFWSDARTAGVTSLALVPHQIELLYHSGFTGAELPSLRYLTQAGGKLSPHLARRFTAMSRENGWQLFIMYGQTEAAPRISYVPPDALPEAADTIGRAIPGGRLWLASEDGAEITTPGQPGELVYAGPNVMMGYATSRGDLLRGQDMEELRTGDLAERTEAGFFRIVGRMKRFVKLFGLRISLDQVESFLSERGVEAHAVGLEDRLVILLRESERGAETIAALADQYDLPPAAFHIGYLAETPRLSSGKPDQVALRRIAADLLATSEQSQTGEKLAEVLKRATRSSSVGPEDSFNSLGGDSLSYLQVQLFLEERLGHAPQGWESMPLSRLEGLVRETDGVASARVRIGVDVLLRLLAISLVVVQHATDYPVYGGTWMLIALMGFSMARFQLHQIAAGNPFRLAARMLYPIVPLYFLILVAYALLRDSVPLSYWFLVGNYKIWNEGSLLEVYWFVSVYAQIVIVMALASAVPKLRRALVQCPWATMAMSLLANALILGVIALWQNGSPLPYHPQRGLLECLSVFMLGWMLQHIRGGSELVLTACLAAVVLGLQLQIGMSWAVAGAILATFALIALKAMIPVPAILGRALTALASVTLFVYLLHEIFVFTILKATLPQPISAGLALIVSFGMAILAQRVMLVFEDAVAADRSQRIPSSR